MTMDLDQLLAEKFTSTFRCGYINFEGHILPKRYEELRAAIDDFEVFDDDVWICSFPKTGTTWCQEMIWLLGNNLDYTAAEENLGARFPFLEVSMVFDWRKLQATDKNFKPPIFLDDSLSFTAKRKRPRFIKTHLPWDLLPRAIRDRRVRPKIIYITRNPRDTCVSYFHHARLLEGFRGEFDEFLQLFLNGKLIFGPFWENVLPFWHQRASDNLLFLRYEDMKSDLSEVINSTAKFLGKSINASEKSRLLTHLSFAAMKSNPAVNYEPIIDFHRLHGLIYADGVFMRAGAGAKTGNKPEITPNVALMFDKWIQQNDPHNQLNYQ